MKFTLSWLKTHLETDATLEQIADRLTSLGLEVESCTDRAKQFAPFRVAYVEKAEKHPDADRLKVCIVDTGSQKLQVVCGAPNARTGMKGIFAPDGSFIPGTGVTLKKGVIRGQESNGMLVSEREMGLSDEHAGIIDIPADVPVGTPFAQLYGLDDPVIEIGLTPNRPDCAGVRGIARDLAAAGLGTLKPLDETPVKGIFKSPVGVSLKFSTEAKDACPLFLGRYIRGVKNGPSPAWLQNRLKAIGLRPISALVDVTNYLSYDLCRPLHVFDADKLKGDIHVRLAKKGEKLAALNDTTYELDDFMTAVCDESGVIGLGGVIGGAATGCSEKTENVYIECAYFDPPRIARTGRTLQINSDARYRFERGIDPAFTIPAMEIATRLVLEICGGAASETVTAGSVPAWQRKISFDPAYTQQLAGLDIPVAEQSKILEKLGFTVNQEGKTFSVQPPSWRGDIDGRADIVEEIARVAGLDRLPSVSVPKDSPVTASAETPMLARARRTRAALAERGMDECITWSFLPSATAAKFGANDNQNAAALRLTNPISSELDQMRPGLLPNLLEAAQRNHDKCFANSALFEVGPAFSSAQPDGQKIIAAGVRYGTAVPRHWADKNAGRAVDLFDVKADAMAALEACGMPVANLQISRDAPAWYHPGRSGTLRLGPGILAHFGEIHPAIINEMGIKSAAAGFEVFLDAVPAARKKGGTAKPLLHIPAFQPVTRDFAFIVDLSAEADVIARTAKLADKTLITAVDIFDIYTGKGVPEGRKSVAFSVTLQPVNQTLTDQEIEAVCSKIIDSVLAKTGGALRS